MFKKVYQAEEKNIVEGNFFFGLMKIFDKMYKK